MSTVTTDTTDTTNTTNSTDTTSLPKTDSGDNLYVVGHNKVSLFLTSSKGIGILVFSGFLLFLVCVLTLNFAGVEYLKLLCFALTGLFFFIRHLSGTQLINDEHK